MNLLTTSWPDYPGHRFHGRHTVVGHLKRLSAIASPQLHNKRDILVYLPPSYAHSQKHYPVIYMQDGQNLFDRATSFLGEEWQVDENMEHLSHEGIEAIVVGIYHSGGGRMAEFNPFGGKGDLYLDFIVDTLKPLIDRDFRTETARWQTGIMGSSLGGLISLYAYFRRPDVFGWTGAMSPAFWVGRGAIYRYVAERPLIPGKIYLDNGSRENSAKMMYDLLKEKGYRRKKEVLHVVEKGAKHTESAWARRFPNALRFAFDKLK